MVVAQDSLVKIDDISKIIPDRIKDSHKGDYGKVALLGGAVEYSGAIRLAALALSALKSGAGLSTVAIPKFLIPIVSQNILEVMIYPLDSTGDKILFNKDNIDGLLNKIDVLACGMGLGRSEEAHKIIYYIIENFSGKLILDADALNILSENLDILNKSKAKIVLTPHMMEFMRLYDGMKNIEIRKNYMMTSNAHPDFDELKKHSLFYAEEFIKTFDVILLLKGPITYILSRNISNNEEELINKPDNDISIKIAKVCRGTPGMATAGSGDVLSGIITGLLGYITNEYDAAVAAAFINGLAGELAAKDVGEISMTSSDTIRFIPAAFKQIKESI